MKLRGVGAALAVAATALTGCDQVSSALDQAGNAKDKAVVCAEALGLADLNPLVDPARIKERAADKERRLRELAGNVSDGDVRKSLLTMADSYVEVQKEHFDDLTVVAGWAKRNAARLDGLRSACV